jgi:hypothetical protein
MLYLLSEAPSGMEIIFINFARRNIKNFSDGFSEYSTQTSTQ